MIFSWVFATKSRSFLYFSWANPFLRFSACRFQLSLESAPGERYNHVASWDGGLWIHGGQQPPGGSMDLSSLWSYESDLDSLFFDPFFHKKKWI